MKGLMKNVYIRSCRVTPQGPILYPLVSSCWRLDEENDNTFVETLQLLPMYVIMRPFSFHDERLFSERSVLMIRYLISFVYFLVIKIFTSDSVYRLTYKDIQPAHM